MKKVGILTDRRRAGKMSSFIKYIAKLAKVEVILGDALVVDFTGWEWDVDVILIKTKDPVSLSLLTSIKDSGIPMINPLNKIFLTYRRFLLNSILSNEEIPQPRFAFSLSGTTPFKRAIIKGDEDRAPEKRPAYLSGTDEPDEKKTCHYYSQEFIEPNREYKVYCIGDKLFTYRQKTPVIYNRDFSRDKHAFCSLEKSTKAEELARRAVRATGLKICSVDIIENNENYFIVDINATPGLAIKEVIETLSDYLLEVAL